MRAFGVLAMAPWTIIALAACVWGIHEWLYPPFTDEELQNFVDTWEPSAWLTMIALIALAFVAIISLPVAILVRQRPVREVATVTVLLAFAAGAIVFRNHVELTRRVTELTGQTFGGFNGLGIF
jgi:ABC-type sugar transport system permease subunit